MQRQVLLVPDSAQHDLRLVFSNEMDSPVEYRFGGVEARIEGSLLLVRPHGILQPSEAAEIVNLMQQFHRQHGVYFVFGDLRDAGGIPPELRRFMVKQAHAFMPAAAAFFTPAMIPRGVTALLIGAVNLLGKQRQNIRIFAAEKEARDWLAGERKRLGHRPTS